MNRSPLQIIQDIELKHSEIRKAIAPAGAIRADAQKVQDLCLKQVDLHVELGKAMAAGSAQSTATRH